MQNLRNLKNRDLEIFDGLLQGIIFEMLDLRERNLIKSKLISQTIAYLQNKMEGIRNRAIKVKDKNVSFQGVSCRCGVHNENVRR